MININWKAVNSSQITHIAHNNWQQTLYIMFKNGKVYSYSPVSKDIFTEMLNSESVGGYFHKHIKTNSQLKPTQENEKQ